LLTRSILSPPKDNILIDGSATAFLSDLGNCVVVEDVLSLEPAGETFMGAVRWSAPQLLQGGPKTEASDVFAFGMTMLEVGRLSHSSASVRILPC
jgi:hypothetical protein